MPSLGGCCFLACVNAKTGKTLFGPRRLPGIQNVFASLVGAAPGPLTGVETLPGCVLVPSDGLFFNHMIFLVLGMFFGSFAAAVGAGEFKLRVPKRPVRYAQSLGGGVIMGYGSGIGMGCTIGAFFSAIPSLAVKSSTLRPPTGCPPTN